MGLTYTFELFLAVDQVDTMLRAVSRHLAAEDRARLEAALPWQPEVDRMAPWPGGPPARHRRGIRGMARKDDEKTGGYCLTFEFPRDAALDAYEAEMASMVPPTRGDTVRVGCVWSEITAGETFALFRASAAITIMSCLFQDSETIGAAWHGIAQACEAHALFLYLDDADWELRYPATGLFPMPDDTGFMLDDDYRLSVDAFAEDALRLASLA